MYNGVVIYTLWCWCILTYYDVHYDDDASYIDALLYSMMYMYAMVSWRSSMHYDVCLMMMHTQCTLRGLWWWGCIPYDDDAYPMMTHYDDAYLCSVKEEQNYLFCDYVWRSVQEWTWAVCAIAMSDDLAVRWKQKLSAADSEIGLTVEQDWHRFSYVQLV